MAPTMETILTRMDELTEQFMRQTAGEWANYPKGVTPRETIWKAGNISLLKFESPADTTGTPILIIPSLINRWYIMDVTEKTSYIKSFTQNRPTYLIDWGYPGEEAGHLPLSHYYHRSIKRAIRQIKKATNSEKVDMLGYCIGGTMAYAFSCLEPDLIDHLILLTAPLDFKEAGILAKYANTFPADEFSDSMELMPGWVLAFSFNFIQPLGTYQKTKLFKKKCDSQSFRELFNAMERWIADPVDFPAKAYYELLTDLYKENLLSQGKLETADGITVDPSMRSAKTLILNAAKDHIAPVPTTWLPKADKKPAQQVTIPAGHIGITTGRQGKVACDTIIDFIQH